MSSQSGEPSSSGAVSSHLESCSTALSESSTPILSARGSKRCSTAFISDFGLPAASIAIAASNGCVSARSDEPLGSMVPSAPMAGTRARPWAMMRITQAQRPHGAILAKLESAIRCLSTQKYGPTVVTACTYLSDDNQDVFCQSG